MKTPQFGHMLSEAIRLISVSEGKTIQAVQDELGYALGRKGGAAIVRWRAGHLPPEIYDREMLARLLVERSHNRLDREWLARFLYSARHPYPEKLCADLFPDNPTAVHAIETVENKTPANLLPSVGLPSSLPKPMGMPKKGTRPD